MVIFVRNSFKLNFIFLYQSTGHETMFYRFQYVKFSPDHSHAIISFFYMTLFVGGLVLIIPYLLLVRLRFFRSLMGTMGVQPQFLQGTIC